MSDTNTNLINALTRAVLSNASDTDLIAEVSGRRIAEASALTDNELKDEMIKRGLVSDDPQQALNKLAELLEKEGVDASLRVALERLSRVMDDEIILERTQTLSCDSMDDLISTLVDNVPEDILNRFDDDVLWDNINDQESIIENELDSMDDAQLWNAIKYKDDIIKDNLAEASDEDLWDAIADKGTFEAQAIGHFVSVCTPEQLADLLKQIAARVASEMAA
jgi:hypothetical protein